MLQKTYLILGALFALLANGLGAFGAHALKGKISFNYLAAFQTGVQYQFYHSLALLLLALLLFNIKNSWLLAAGMAFILGILLFSGSLYVLSISQTKWVGVVTPFGGISFLVGWTLMLIGVLKAKL